MPSAPTGSRSSRARPGPILRPADVHLYRLSDDTSGLLILGLCLFSPWAFGTTESWSTWVMNVGGDLLALLWLIKLGLRRFKAYPAARHDSSSSCLLIRALFTLTIALLLFTLVSAWNARATYDPASFSFVYHDAIPWLPSSLDSASTWFAFWQYLALAGCFWALRDWLLGKSDREHTGPPRDRTLPLADGDARAQHHLLPARLRALLWVLAVNGAFLGIEGILQRLEGSGRLLFLIRPTVNPGAESQFGPWAYRANAAAYFNLLWPVTLGFWWTLHRSARTGQFRRHLLLVCVTIMAACPIISTSRGGAVIAFALVLATAGLFIAAQFLLDVPRHWTILRWAVTLLLILGFLAGGLYLGYRLGWTSLAPRMEEFELGFELREKMFDVARPMAADYPWYGTGPGTFGWVFQLYRGATDAYWPAQLHNDWLETRITFGGVGVLLIATSFILVLARWFQPGGIHGGRRLVALIWLALAGLLVHARWDFPFQIHSIVFLFVLLCAILSVLSKGRWDGGTVGR